MAQDARKKLQKVLKKRRKEQAKKKQRNRAAATSGPVAALARAHAYPIHECLINPDWQETRMAHIAVARKQSDTQVMYGVYLIDLGCLGVKNAFCNADVPMSKYQELRDHFQEKYGSVRAIPPSLAHQIVYEGLDYANNIGFKPHEDFALARRVLEPREAFSFDHDVEFGLDGQPYYVSGPNDNVGRIMDHLERRLGPGNFKFLAAVPDEEWIENMDDDLGRTD